MAKTALECANRALQKLGCEVVTAIDGTTDTSKEAMFCYRNIDLVKKSLLRDYPWNFAMRRDRLLPPSRKLISNIVYSAANVAAIDIAAHGYSVGDFLTFEEITTPSELDGTWEVASVVDVDNITVTVPDLASGIDNYTSPAYTRLSPAYEYSYLYTLPSDCLRVITINDEAVSDDWKIEGGKVLSDDESSILIRYVKNVTDYDTMDDSFYECLAAYLAWEGCDHLTGGANKKRDLHTDLWGGDGKPGLLPKAKFIDVSEDSLSRVQGDDWIGARFGGGGGFEPVTVETSAV